MKGWRSVDSLTPTEAAAIAGVSRSAFYLEVHAGTVPTVHVKGVQRVRPADLAAYIDRRKVTAREAPTQAPLFEMPTTRGAAPCSPTR